MSLFQTSKGKLEVTRTGRTGPLIIFIHGGPGMSSAYLRTSLKGLSEHYRLLFFDQLGCGLSDLPPDFNISTVTESAAELINHHAAEEKEYYVFAHSWGAYLFMRFINGHMLGLAPEKIIFCNPAPLSSEVYDKAMRSLVSKMPRETLLDIDKMAKRGTNKDGAALLRAALPYYCGRQENLPALDFEYSLSSHKRIMAGMETYDFNKDFSSISDRSYFIFGSTDFIRPEDFQGVRNSFVLNGGHYVFEEDKKGLMLALNEIIR